MTEKKMIHENFAALEESVSGSSAVFNAITAGVTDGLARASQRQKRREIILFLAGVGLILAGLNFAADPILGSLIRYVPDVSVWVLDAQRGLAISLEMLIHFTVKASLHVSLYLWFAMICFGFASEGTGPVNEQKLQGAII